MTMDLHALAEKVEDEAGFLRFLAALATDWGADHDAETGQPSNPYGSEGLGWENGTLGAFLDAAATWGQASTHGLPRYEKPANPWRRMADVLLAGKYYE
ncbi:hypothetical protein SAMN05216359_101411 [Roseateles sp. YR242]|uniref:DUF7660 family protein n=1 Tax=Roseateles sp. YR242 TaxID=1855305 RepID=UPI0008C4198F|nr:hypothetical protein [Roseateles sp. YR242]SEK31926.1 hypothetical protein SAMN05216359_101411 [Roseateles sp. YR242]